MSPFGGRALAKDVCIVISVAQPEGLDALPGALPSAQRFASWANSQGYDVSLVSDDVEPVTCEGLASAFHQALGTGGQNRILVAFTGHGLIRGPAEEYWLLSNWRRSATEAVNHMKLRDRLETYRPKQIGIVSDACRSLPTDRARFVEGNGVVDIKDYVQEPVQFARLAGTQAAQPAFATPLGADQAFCFFMQVLTNALLGIPADVVELDESGRRVVLNDKLFRVVQRELPLLAGQYDRRQVPQLDGSWLSPLPDNIWSVLPDAPPPKPKIIGPLLGLIGKPAEFRAVRGEAERLEQAAKDRTEAFRRTIRNQARATHFETGSGLVVGGANVAEVIVSPGFQAERDFGNPNWFRFHPQRPAASLGIRLDNGMFIAGAAYHNMIGTFTVGEFGADAYVLRPAYDGEDAIDAPVARAATSAVNDPYELAAKLRRGKHSDPVLGALAAYAYAQAGAIEDIRRTCFFYAERSQPVPFDAALLARIPLERRGPNLIAHVPPVPERAPRNEAEAAAHYTFGATPAGTVDVAGAFPWLRQGWALLEDRREFQALSRFATSLLPSVFTTFHPRASQEVAALIRSGEL